jgi:hypothetical protein
MNNKRKLIGYMQGRVCVDTEHIADCRNNLTELLMQNPDYTKMDSCPTCFDMDNYVEDCFINEKDYSCSRCWKNAVEGTKIKSTSEEESNEKYNK